MNSVIFAHHHGQFYNPDTNSKVAIELGKKLFIEMIHDVSKHTSHYSPINIIIILSLPIQITYSLPKYLPPENNNGPNVTCTEDRNFWTDDCIINVSKINDSSWV